jgi:hypothetical protein
MSIMEAGSILKSTWGYDQTNVNFFTVVKVQNGWAWVQPVGQEIVESQPAYMSEKVVPAPNATGKVFRRKIQNYGGDDYVGINSYAAASVWSGQPITQTHTH